MSDLFFTSTDHLYSNPYREDPSIFTTEPCSYPKYYTAIQFNLINDQRLFCRRLQLANPSAGQWIILDEWTRPTPEAEAHYTKQLVHMDFPQILEFDHPI